VVASAADGVTELLGSAAAEQSVPVGNFSQLGRRLVEIVTNPVLSKDLGLKNQARATTEFSVDSMVGRYEQLYLSLAGK
jgi:glycosyltransferase involved in cell wall biosynthesis